MPVKGLNPKEKELISLAASIAAGCVPCTDHHAKAVREAGAAEEQVRDAIDIALEVRTNTASILVATAHGNTDGEYPGDRSSRSLSQQLTSLVSVGAAVAGNSVAGLEFYLGKAQEAGAPYNQIHTAAGIGRAIRKSAAEKVDANLASQSDPTPPKEKERQGECFPQDGDGQCGCSKEDDPFVEEQQKETIRLQRCCS